jgi:hypothetical protein
VSSTKLSGIRFEDRIFLTGATRTGKSTLARHLYLNAAGPRTIIDPYGSTATKIAGQVTFSDPGRATNRAGENWREAAHSRFVPRDPEDLDAYDAVYRWIFANKTRWVWLDEAEHPLPAHGGSSWGRRVLIHGAKRMIGHLACHTRPREVNRNLVAQAAHVFVFDLPNPDDLAHIAKLAGIPVARLEGAMASVPEHGFVWWDSRARLLTPCLPLR